MGAARRRGHQPPCPGAVRALRVRRGADAGGVAAWGALRFPERHRDDARAFRAGRGHVSAEVTPRFVVEALVDANGVADLGRVYDVAVALGIGEQPVRLAIRRMITTGDAEQQGRGRRGTLHLNPAARVRDRHDVVFVHHAYRQDAGEAPWDGAWRLCAFSVPEARRATRDTLRATLVRLGGAALGPGLYVSAHDWDALIDAETADTDGAGLLTRATTSDLRVGDLRDPRAIAARLWPARPVLAAYRPLAALLDNVAAGGADAWGSDEPGRIALALRLAVAFDHALVTDPLLPPELRPAPWPPTELRARFRAVWATVADEEGSARLYTRY
ncbi:PaaX family transcriptional regulator [Archangium violaceum]|nr:PaaX family transcriptional regulator [Archangium violaceum]